MLRVYVCVRTQLGRHRERKIQEHRGCWWEGYIIERVWKEENENLQFPRVKTLIVLAKKSRNVSFDVNRRYVSQVVICNGVDDSQQPPFVAQKKSCSLEMRQGQ